MQCPDKLEWNTYLDGETRRERELLLQDHLKRCPFCQDVVSAIRDDNRMLKDALNEIHIPPDLGAYIEFRVLRQERAWSILKGGIALLVFSSGLFALASEWIPLFKWLGATLHYMLGGSLAMQMMVFLCRLLTIATGYVLRGEPVGMTPTLVVLLACLAGLLVQSRKGGYGNA